MPALLGITLLLASCDSSLTSSPSSSSNNGVQETKYHLLEDTFYNPLVIDANMGDPWLYYHQGMYYYTQSEAGRVRVTRSPHMTQLTSNDSDPERTKIIFRQKSINVVEIWAPEIFFFEGHWYVYFTATSDAQTTIEKDSNRRTYGMKSVTDDAFGEWHPAVKITLPCDYRSIDATFLNYQGKQYIIWAGWPYLNNAGYHQNLYLTELETGNPLMAKSIDPSKRHLISEPEEEWETSSILQNEGPTAIISPGGRPVLFYSGNFSGDDSYCIAYLVLDGTDITNKSHWTKTDKPLMATDMAYSEVIAPGHCSIAKSPDQSEWWIMYHAAKYSGAGWNRMARLQKFTWVDDQPFVDKIVPFSDAQPLPSGELKNRFKVYEAEDASLSEDCYIIDKTGYASGDRAVSISSNEGSINFEVAVNKNGPYVITVRFSNRDSMSQLIDITVNGVKRSIYAPKTEYDDLFTNSSFFSDLYIKRTGLNTISISADASIYIDCLIIDSLDN